MLASSENEANGVECRICHSKTTRDLILSPCLCKGSMAYVHFLCLERWLNYSSRDSCELCSYKFNVVMSRRYMCLESVGVWLRHPTNRSFILCDLVIGLILTLLTFALVIICFVGLSHFVEEGHKSGIASFWSEGVVYVFLMILLIGYLGTLFSMVRDHIRPWYSWWTRCNNVRLVFEKGSALPLPMTDQNHDTTSKTKPEFHEQNLTKANNFEGITIENEAYEYGKEVEILNITGIEDENKFNLEMAASNKSDPNDLKPSTSQGITKMKISKLQGTSKMKIYLEIS